MKFDWFVIPFSVGFLFVMFYITIKFILWIKALNRAEKILLIKYIFSFQIFTSLKEFFLESLLHRKILKTNVLLGYMHLSLAFGWFLLIVIGNIEVKFYSAYTLNPPYLPIFFNFFEPNPNHNFLGRVFKFLMDFMLLFVLSGVALAYFKRFYARVFGMKRSMPHIIVDRIAIIFLWLIFPARLLAESFSAALYHNGSFLTNTIVGNKTL